MMTLRPDTLAASRSVSNRQLYRAVSSPATELRKPRKASSWSGDKLACLVRLRLNEYTATESAPSSPRMKSAMASSA